MWAASLLPDVGQEEIFNYPGWLRVSGHFADADGAPVEGVPAYRATGIRFRRSHSSWALLAVWSRR